MRVLLIFAALLLLPLPEAAAIPDDPGLGRFATELATADGRVEASLQELKALAAKDGRAAAEVVAAGERLAGALEAARAVVGRYRDAGLTFGSQGEHTGLRSVERGLAEAVARFGRLAGAPSRKPTGKERRRASRTLSGLREVAADAVEARLGVEGLGEVLRDPAGDRLERTLTRTIRRHAQDAAEAHLKRITRFGVSLTDPVHVQIRRVFEERVGELIARTLVSAGPAQILIRLLVGDKLDPVRIVRLIEGALREALRNKGDIARRVQRTVDGFDALRRQVETLPPNAPVKDLRRLLRRARAAAGATVFLEGDIRSSRRHTPEQKQAFFDRLIAAGTPLAELINRFRAVADSVPLSRNLGDLASDLGRLAGPLDAARKKLDSAPGGAVTPPTRSTCVPGVIRMERTDLYGNPTGTEFDAVLRGLEIVHEGDEYQRKCVWTADSTSGPEAFVAVVDYAHDGVPGRIPSGDCGHTSDDPLRSDLRFLSVSGGERQVQSRAKAGNLRVLVGVREAAEAQRVGRACP